MLIIVGVDPGTQEAAGVDTPTYEERICHMCSLNVLALRHIGTPSFPASGYALYISTSVGQEDKPEEVEARGCKCHMCS